jgi:peptidoglycan-associated lipoprotein
MKPRKNVLPRLVLPAAALSLALATGCAHQATVHPVARVTPKTTVTPKPTPAPDYSGAAVSVSGDIMRECNIVFDDVARAPKFEFDESTVSSEDRGVLDQIAVCMTTGPLAGRALKVVGRADPRGEIEYNFALGGQRAGSVTSYLAQAGMSRAKILETSRGKLDATGTDEAGWARDRRVDIVLQ